MQEQESLLNEVEFIPVLATAGQRFGNYFIDVLVFNFFINFIKPYILVSTGIFRLTINYYAILLLSFLISYVFFAVFYFLSELVFKGRTIGKFVTGTKAVNQNGSAMTSKTTLIRSLCRIIPFEPFSALTGNPWHDQLSHTHVIDVKKTNRHNL